MPNCLPGILQLHNKTRLHIAAPKRTHGLIPTAKLMVSEASVDLRAVVMVVMVVMTAVVPACRESRAGAYHQQDRGDN